MQGFIDILICLIIAFWITNKPLRKVARRNQFFRNHDL